MRPLALTLARAGGRGRALLVVLATALSTALVLVAISIARLGDQRSSGVLVTYGGTFDGAPPAAGLIGPLQDPGTRGGAVFGVVLLVLPLLLLLDQAVRLGSSSRHRRYAALAVAGATRSDLRRWGALEVGLPAALGALLGVPLWLLLRLLLGTLLEDGGRALVPTGVGPGAWAVLALAGVAAYGVLVGVRSGARAPALLASTRRLRRAPRPWGLLVVVAAVALAVPAASASSDLAIIGFLAGLVLGLALLSPWLAWLVARLCVGRADSAEMVLALRRLVADPGPAGRAAAATGAVALAGGVIGPFIGGVVADESGVSDVGYYVGPALLVGVLAVLATTIIAATLAIHSTETVLERRRELASLVAVGVPPRVVSRSQLLEVWVATLPLAVLAAFLGSFGFWLLGGGSSVLWPVASMAATVAVVAGAGWVTHRLARPWVRDAVQPANLRTE